MCDLICGGHIGFYSFTPVARLVSYENRKCGPENWVGNWEQFEWSPLGGWIPSAHIVPLEDESARGDRSKKLKILRMRKEAT